jgi:hypothetical protein
MEGHNEQIAEDDYDPGYTLEGGIVIRHPKNAEAFIEIGFQEFPDSSPQGYTKKYGIVASNGVGGLREIEATPDGLLIALAVMLGYEIKKVGEGFTGWDSPEAFQY